MSSYSCFMSKASYNDYYAGKEPESNPYLGREDSETGEHKVCCMPSEEADELVAKHTNEDGSLNTFGVETDLGLDEGSFNDGCMRCDFEHEGEVQPTEINGINDNGQCAGDGTLPGGQSDLEAINAKRENITNVQEYESSKNKNQTEDESQSENQAQSDGNGPSESANQSADTGQSNDDGYDYSGYGY